jgi:hypothetical protein
MHHHTIFYNANNKVAFKYIENELTIFNNFNQGLMVKFIKLQKVYEEIFIFVNVYTFFVVFLF